MIKSGEKIKTSDGVVEVSDKIRIFRGGEFYTRAVFLPGGETILAVVQGGKIMLGRFFPPRKKDGPGHM